MILELLLFLAKGSEEGGAREKIMTHTLLYCKHIDEKRKIKKRDRESRLKKKKKKKKKKTSVRTRHSFFFQHCYI